MSFLDSPVTRCETARTIVLTDQTQAQCGQENTCSPKLPCPLESFFGELSLEIPAQLLARPS